MQFWGDEADRLTVTLFIAVSVAVSALAVVAKVLSDLGLMRRDVGQITVAAGMANDLIGWVILGIGVVYNAALVVFALVSYRLDRRKHLSRGAESMG